MAKPDTQLPVAEVGLRVMHRTVIQGTNRPWSDAKESLQENMVTTIGPQSQDNLDQNDIELEDVDIIRDYSFGNMEKMQKLSKALHTL